MKRDPLKSRLESAKARLELAQTQLRLDRVKLQKRAMKAALSTYKAASRDRNTRAWKAAHVSADAAIIPDATTLNARARQMVNDDGYAKSAVRSFQRNVIGTGIWPSFSATDRNRNPMTNFNATAGVEWYDWASNKNLVDIAGKRNFVGIQKWFVSDIVTVGEAFIIWRYDKARFDKTGKCGLVLQCMEADQLDTTIMRHLDNEVRGGIEVDQFGKAIAYHFWTKHPNDLLSGGGRWNPDPSIRQSDTRDPREAWEKGTQGPFGTRSIRVDAEHVIHGFDPERASQTRGVTRFHSVLQRMRDLGEFEYAELLKAKAQACVGMTIESDPADFSALGLNVSGDENPNIDPDGNDELAMQPMMVARLNPGEKATAFTPTSPGGQFQPFVMQNSRAVAAGLGLSYEQLVRDFTNGSFSSQRQSLLEDRREFQMFIADVCSNLCQPVVQQFIEWGILEGRLPGGSSLSSLTYVKWRGQGWQWVDPEKEVNAHEKALSLGLETKEEILGEKGEDWRETTVQVAAEREFTQELAKESGEPDAETFNGAQVQSAVEVLVGVSAKTLSPETAVSMLVQFFKLPEDVARKMVAAQGAVTAIPQDNATLKLGAA